MGWWAVLNLVLTYGPSLFEAIRNLIVAIRSKNPEQGAAAVKKATVMARNIVLSLQSRSDLKNPQKREQAWKDLVMGMKLQGVVLSETNARTLTQTLYQDVSGK